MTTDDKRPSGAQAGRVPSVWTCPKCGDEFVVTLDQAATHERLCDGPESGRVTVGNAGSVEQESESMPMPCLAALNIKGKHYACENKDSHVIHRNVEAQAIWSSHDEVVGLPK